MVRVPLLRCCPAEDEHDHDDDADEDDEGDEHDARNLEGSFYQPFLVKTSIAVDVDEPLCHTTQMRPTTR